MNGETFGGQCCLACNFFEGLACHCRVRTPIVARPTHALPDAAKHKDLLSRHKVARVVQRIFEDFPQRCRLLFEFLLAHDATVEQALRVQLAHAGVSLDLAI
jgi:hypothetical protein